MNLQSVESVAFTCGYCSRVVSSNRGYSLGKFKDGSGGLVGGLYPCPECKGITFQAPDGRFFPAPVLGNPVHLFQMP
jgi:hypothetical protein